MPNTVNIAIIGAGLAGRLLAYRLSTLNYQIDLYEADKLDLNTSAQYLSAAAFTAAGMIAPISEAIDTDLDTYFLGKTSLSLWPGIIERLNLSAKQAIDYQHNGSLIICHPQDQAELNHFTHKVKRLSLSCDAQFKALDAQQIKDLEPSLCGQFNTGLLLEDEAHIDNRQLMHSLLLQCVTNGVRIIDQAKVQINNNCVISDNLRQSYDWVFDCRGVGAKTQLKQLRGVRGEILRVESKEITLKRPVRLMHPRYQLYLVPKPNQQFVIGATQIESEDTSPVSVQSMLELCSAMYSINPAFSQARILEQNTNLRPALSDNKPKVIVRNRHISINGLFRHGFLIAPAIVDTVVNWLQGNPSDHQQRLFSFLEH